MTQEWRAQRDRAVAAHAAALADKRAAEAAKARGLIAEFLRDAPPPQRLTCLSYDGRTRYRTKLMGWFLNKARTVAVDVSGNYYVLLVPPSFRARFGGIEPVPQDPPLIVGEGGRDGESMPLKDLLARLVPPSTKDNLDGGTAR